MKKIAVLFPGVGYHTDKPLLYYSKRLLKKHGFEIVELNYRVNPQNPFFDILKSKTDSTSKAFKDATIKYVIEAEAGCSEDLRQIRWKEYDQVIFVSKSIGSVVAALYAQKQDLNPIQILFTPLEPAFQFLNKEEGIVFCGANDPLVNYEHIKELCIKRNFSIYLFDQCNHSLESNNIETDLKNLEKFMGMVELFLTHTDTTVYNFTVKNINQQTVSLEDYKGQVLLIVNTATGCGFTPQYTILEELYEAYRDKDFAILDFPCNQFLNQAPGSDEEIHSFCTSRYNTMFPQFSKINVNGEHASELFSYLKSRRGFQGFNLNTQEGQFLDRKVRSEFPDYESTSDIKWNFTKFLIDRNGQVVERYEPTANFEDMKKDIERLL